MGKDSVEGTSGGRDVAPRIGAAKVAPDYRPAVDAVAQRLIERIQHDHQDAAAITELAAHYEAHADYPSLANLMEGWASALRDDRKAADAYTRAADAVVLGLADRERAQRLYVSALARYPEHELALTRLEGLLREFDDYIGLERCYSQVVADLARRHAYPKLRAAVHLRFGKLYEERLLLPGRAITQYRQALDLDPSLVPAITAAREIYLGSNKPEAAADMYELEIAATPELADRHGLLVALASHRQEILGDLDGAVLALRRALKALPKDPTTLALLARLLHQRAQDTLGESADADRSRAAELYYQVARSVPRGLAQPYLVACIELRPEHPRAAIMLSELNAYGAGVSAEGDRMPAAADTPQAELDVRATRPMSTVRWVEEEGVAMADRQAEADVEAWLDDEHVTMIDQEVGPESMIQLSERPPPPVPDSTPPHMTDTSPAWRRP